MRGIDLLGLGNWMMHCVCAPSDVLVVGGRVVWAPVASTARESLVGLLPRGESENREGGLRSRSSVDKTCCVVVYRRDRNAIASVGGRKEVRERETSEVGVVQK